MWLWLEERRCWNYSYWVGEEDRREVAFRMRSYYFRRYIMRLEVRGMGTCMGGRFCFGRLRHSRRGSA